MRIVLLGSGEDLAAWQMTDGSAPTWTMKAGVLQTGKGVIQTKQEFTDFQLHVEFATPAEVKGDSQGRGNSGVFLLGKFEIQVLDSYRNLTYPDGQAAAMYGQHPPLVNASRRPGEWQTYDIIFTAPRFDAKSALEKPAVVTVLHNGVLVHDAAAFWGPTRHRSVLPYTADMAKGPIALQDHGNPVRYRNIWIRPARSPYRITLAPEDCHETVPDSFRASDRASCVRAACAAQRGRRYVRARAPERGGSRRAP